jgi:hypothetical protein
MATTKTRINISVSDDIKDALLQLSRRDNMPQATKAARLLELALEIEEHQIWDMIAKKRDTKNARYIDHDKA